MKVQVVFYSMYGHVYRMAEAIAVGARQVPGAEAALFQVPELIPEEALVKSGAKKAREVFAHVPLAQVDKLPEADAIIFGTPTRFGNMCAQMRNFLDRTTQLWLKGSLVGKVGSVFACTATQHGGQETTITSFHSTLLHLGMVIVGVPYSESRLLNMKSPAGRLTERRRSRMPTARGCPARTNWPLPSSKAATWPRSPQSWRANKPGGTVGDGIGS